MGEYLEEPVLVELHVAAGGGHLGMKTVGSRLLGPSNEGVSLEMLLICQHFQKGCIFTISANFNCEWRSVGDLH